MRKFILRNCYQIGFIVAVLIGVLICLTTNAFPDVIKEEAFEKYGLYHIEKTIYTWMSEQEIEKICKWNTRARQLNRIKKHKDLVESSSSKGLRAIKKV